MSFYFSPGYTMDFYICLGGILLTSHVLLSGLDPEWGDMEDFKAVCKVSDLVTFRILLHS